MKKTEIRKITARHIYSVESWAEEWIVDTIDISVYLARGEGLRSLMNLIHGKFPELHVKYKRECLDVGDTFYKDDDDILSWLNEINNWNIEITDLSKEGYIGNDFFDVVMAAVYNMNDYTIKRFWSFWDGVNADADEDEGYMKLELIEG